MTEMNHRINQMAQEQHASMLWYQKSNTMNQNHTELNFPYLAITANQIKKSKAITALEKTKKATSLDPTSKTKLVAIYTQQIEGYTATILEIQNKSTNNITATLAIEVVNPIHL